MIFEICIRIVSNHELYTYNKSKYICINEHIASINSMCLQIFPLNIRQKKVQQMTISAYIFFQ